MVKAVLLILAGLLTILVGLAVLQRDTKKFTNISFVALTVSMAGWTFGITAFLLSNSYDTAFFWAKVYYFFPLLIAIFLMLFAYSFPNYSSVSRKALALHLTGFFSLAIPLVSYQHSLTADIAYHSWGKEVILNQAHYAFYATYLLFSYLASLWVMYAKRKSEKGLYARQAELFAKGFLVTFLIGVSFNLILPWFGNYQLIWLGPLCTNVFVATIAYSVIKHRMFDLRLVVARSLAYLLSLFVLIFSYSTVSFLVASYVFVSDSDTVALRITDFALLVFITLTYPSLKQFFDKITNKIFYRDAYDSEVFLDDLNTVLVSNIELGILLRKSTDLIEANLKPTYCAFYIQGEQAAEGRQLHQVSSDRRKLKDDDVKRVSRISAEISANVISIDDLDDKHEELKATLMSNDISLLVVLRNNSAQKDEEAIGFLFLGPKKSGNPYSRQDLKVVNILANELVIAIQNSLRFEEIQAFAVTLQEKVNEATRELRHTNEKLKALDETKDEFISMASHQLRTPLTSVKGYLSMVLEGDAGEISEMQRKLLDQAFVSSQRMVYLIADLLNVSRLKTGKFIIETTPTNLADVVEGEVVQLKDTAVGRNLTLEYDKPENFPVLNLDETKIRQVIMNFMDNAIYYTKAGGRIKVELKETDKTVEYMVTDDGIGVPKSEQHQLFSKFFRAGNARKARPDGTGLGLFMAKKVVVAQGGSIIFRSEEGKGSTFGFSFAKSKLQPQKPSTSQP